VLAVVELRLALPLRLAWVKVLEREKVQALWLAQVWALPGPRRQ
jgi:hypothetical protein